MTQQLFRQLNATTSLLALGSNTTSGEKDPADWLKHAIGALTKYDLDIKQLSRFYKTPCYPEGAGPEYVNAALAMNTRVSAPDLLELLHRIERDLGRTRGKRWGPRTLDLDLIAVGQTVLPDAETFTFWRDLAPARQRREAPHQLILPHPRLQDRAFVLIPLCEVAPEWRHPVSGLSVREMTDALPEAEKKAVIPLCAT